MKAVLLKRLFSAVRSGSGNDVVAICKKIVEDEKRLGHVKLAKDLERTLERASESKLDQKTNNFNNLSSLPTSRKDVTEFIQVLHHDTLRHHMVLAPLVEKKFKRVEKEYAARSRLAKYGLKARKRVLLYGPPGCGKSLGAERMAWETGLSLYKVRFDTLISSYFGETAFNLGKVFDLASKQPCALFLDECDTIARSRGKANDVGEVSRVVNMLLQLLEDYNGEGMVIAATNHYHALDKAIYRRFDDAIELPSPSITEIARLIKLSLASLEVDKTINFEAFAASLDGFSFSESERIARNAAKHCIMENRKVVSIEDLQIAAREVKHHF